MAGGAARGQHAQLLPGPGQRNGDRPERCRAPTYRSPAQMSVRTISRKSRPQNLAPKGPDFRGRAVATIAVLILGTMIGTWPSLFAAYLVLEPAERIASDALLVATLAAGLALVARKLSDAQ
jgi:hypothetical protein